MSHISDFSTKASILQAIDARVAAQHLLQHPFYQAWTRGELSLDALRDYATQYYHHVAAFPTYLSAVHAQTDDAEVRRQILTNLMDEEAGNPNHPELWLRFAESLGLNRSDVKSSAQWPATKKLIEDFRACCGQRGTGVGLTALYAYESQIPAVSETKIEGLKAFYGFNDPAGYDYFTVHVEADREHAAVEAAQIAQCVNESERAAALEAAGEVLGGLYGLLSAVCERHSIAAACVN
ncbi:pyrroloquinoline-quinone synthase [Silvibacterium bohemicum]|uniref:Pyrroloquinoline-quinone synthase n=1 Tax=Silvibacterium bohemicum TaxID=1577686 RepID=A0A841JZM5_9BACT|nr:CADD family putative folate metabolism protein [Silvibacterium bohemicum]MBB6146943.1 pyrroloquinoline-quinone synthase [Silvibacterium bohemicum]